MYSFSLIFNLKKKDFKHLRLPIDLYENNWIDAIL